MPRTGALTCHHHTLCPHGLLCTSQEIFLEAKISSKWGGLNCNLKVVLFEESAMKPPITLANRPRRTRSQSWDCMSRLKRVLHSHSGHQQPPACLQWRQGRNPHGAGSWRLPVEARHLYLPFPKPWIVSTSITSSQRCLMEQTAWEGEAVTKWVWGKGVKFEERRGCSESSKTLETLGIPKREMKNMAPQTCLAMWPASCTWIL